jgi:hypothetical protein
MNKKKLLIVAAIIAVAALFRFLPHPPNFVPLTAIALFAGAYITDKRLAILIPIGALFISDVIIGFHSTMIFVYASLIAMVGIGMLLQNRKRVSPIAIATLSGSILFFIVTNFGVWVMGTMYPKTIEGLISCYVAAIPFFRNALAGDMVYVTLLFGSFALAQRWMPALRNREIPVKES